MKTSPTLILLFSTLALTAGLSAQTFEGKIRLKTTGMAKSSRHSGGDAPMFMTYSIKGGLMRVDMETGEGKMMGCSIIDPVKREMTMLMPDQKMYMTMKLPEPKPSTASGAPQSDVDFVRTGETEMIVGYKCEKIIVKSKNGDTEVWGAEGLGTFKSIGAGGPMGRPAPKSAWEAALAEHGFFPLRMVSRDKYGNVQMSMEAVSVDKQSLPDSAFTAPADFQKFEMPAIPGFGGGS